MRITVDKNQYTITAGCAVLIFPNQLHSLHTAVHSRHELCIFSTKLVQGYGSTYHSKLPISYQFNPNPFYLDELWRLSDAADLLKAKELLYCLCSEFNASASYRDRKNDKDDLLHRIFTFVEDNYNQNCSLTNLADATTYHPVYLSRYFKQCTGLSFTDHVNRYRVSEASYLLKNNSKKMIDIAFSCGFNSLRSFNRSFKAVTGLTPSEYKSQ